MVMNMMTLYFTTKGLEVILIPLIEVVFASQMTMLYSGHCSASSYFVNFQNNYAEHFWLSNFYLSRKNLTLVLLKISHTLSNILLKNYSILRSPGSSKETQLKVLKLTCKEFIG